MDPESPQPLLPAELERQIFEICASSRPVDIPKLMLVAWRVKEWLEPLLYRTMAVEHDPNLSLMKELPCVTGQLMLSVIQAKPAHFLRDTVRHLYLRDVLGESFVAILSACTGVENLWMGDIVADWTPVLASLPLKHFYGHLHSLLRVFPPTHHVFSQITHIELLGYASLQLPDNVEIWSALGLFPQLTHLSFNDGDFIPVCSRFFETCKSLVVLISLNAPIRMIYTLHAEALAQDPRFVTMNCVEFLKDWQMGAHTGRDYWSRAERFISQRRSGEVAALRYEVPDDYGD
ncbi:hypothetical protein MVEN_00265000 [Mycena venus]|uniref:Uncharacterized protein n=1 Tax=Mycena venus TaxID=2733690 RepID=A0A8H6Z2N3_9AGAR|nr:hypothetical protein MVEN_00265000 [Mycena venus]